MVLFLKLYRLSKVSFATILDLFWVVLHGKLPQMWSNVYKNFTTDAMQDNAWYLRWFLMQYKNSSKLNQKHEFLAHSKTFLVYTFLRPKSYAPICQVKDFMKIHDHGKFHQYTNCGCRSFLYWFSIHEITLFGRILGNYSPKYSPL